MTRIQATDCHILCWPVQDVFDVMTDFGRYSQWWPSRLGLRLVEWRPELVGSRFELRPLGGRFEVEVTRVMPLEGLALQYDNGVQRGYGLWTCRPVPEGTQVCYQVDLRPQGVLPGLLSRLFDFSALHSRMMRQVFTGLNDQLSGLERRREDVVWSV